MGTEQIAPLRRSRSDRVLGGVCAGIAARLDVDPLVVRAPVVVLGLLSGGTALLAYLLAWALIPAGDGADPAPADRAVRRSAREAWAAAAAELRTLATALRPEPAPAAPSPVPRPRSALDTVDATMTAVGERLRDPEVQATARRAARHVSDAVTAGVAGVGRRTPHDGAGPG